jgi:hypothetical protein
MTQFGVCQQQLIINTLDLPDRSTMKHQNMTRDKYFN